MRKVTPTVTIAWSLPRRASLKGRGIHLLKDNPSIQTGLGIAGEIDNHADSEGLE